MENSVLIIRHVVHEPAGTLEDALKRAGIYYHYLDLFDHLPERLDFERLSGMVVMGGPMNVDQIDKYPFLAAEVPWIQEVLARHLPLLGICLGSQLLAKACGAKVYPNRLKEIGWYPLELTTAGIADPLFRDGDPRPTVFQWHGDTFELPRGAVHLAQSPQCRHQAFRVGQNAYGLQFHLEMTAEMIDDWLAKPENCEELDRLHYIDPHLIRGRTPAELPALQAWASIVFDRFAEWCRKQTTA
ncbi:MAG: gamma-glutamyl-gamma-aminobutyrate hydrolase family protein [Pirellulales bacterium]|nr:gamma-glutamyl-gamma-aminobutyrate hydrolase family protein [Pirellulales bacterium]